MNQSDDNGALIAVGSIAAVLAAGAIVMKLLTEFFNRLAQAFDAFGSMVSSFFPMLLNILEIVCLVGGILFIGVASVYFTWKYIQMVKRGTELREYVYGQLNIRLDELRTEVKAELSQTQRVLAYDVLRVEQKLDELLRPATPAAPIPSVDPDTAAADAVADETGSFDTEPDEDSNPTDEEDSDASCAPIPVSQPY